jgi:hypothetical protein
MNVALKTLNLSRGLLIGGAIVASVTVACGQVSPTEVLNPRAKADEQKYLPQLVSLQKAIGGAQFPFTFRLARYLDSKPGQRAALDSNGIEFVYFQEKVVLKVSAFYRVAFDSMQVTQNGRASQTLQDAVLPVLRLITEQMPQNYDYDAIGFEILYDARDSGRSYDYEGHEVLTMVFGRDDAFAFANATTNAERQEILNRSDIFVNSKVFGLALDQSDPLNLQTIDRPATRPTVERASYTPPRVSHIATAPAAISPDVSDAQTVQVADSSSADLNATGLQRKLQAEVNAIRDGQGANSRQEDKMHPSLESNGGQKELHYTMQNTLSFERTQSSIYKRAAQSFDLFLAPELRDISNKVPPDAAVDALHFSVLNRLGAEKNETVEYICPMDSMRSFVENKITTQDLINKSIVLVNGVRIGLDLEKVE